MSSLDTVFTPRLRGERLQTHHRAELCRMHQDARIMATLGGVRSDDDTQRWSERNLEHWERHGFGLWMFFDLVTGSFVGRGGLRQVEVESRNEVEVAYALRSEYWKQGLGTEMANVSVQAAFEVLKLPNVVAFTLPDNRGSRRVMEKAGFRYERPVVWVELPHVLYRRVP